MKMKISIGLIFISLVISVYLIRDHKSKFEVNYYNDNYDIGLITSAYDALGINNNYQHNELYLLTKDKIYNKQTELDSWPTSSNFALVNNEIIYENFNSIIKYIDGKIKDNKVKPTDVYFANYLEKYQTQTNLIIFNRINELSIYNPTDDSYTDYPINDLSHTIIGYDDKTKTIKTISKDEEYYYSIVNKKDEISKSLDTLLPEWNDSYEVIGGINNGQQIVTHKYVDLNTAEDLYPFQIWDLETGELENIIEPGISTQNTGSSLTPEAIIGNDKYIISSTNNGYIYKTDIQTQKSIEYDISDLHLTNTEAVAIQYVPEDDSIYLISQPVNTDKYLQIYNVTNGEVILKAEIDRNEQFFSGFIINNKNV